ncbi:(E3-independent) E2 ubiquitin-conjugating enzyme UBE2O-like [Ptychodera flava]|uniref:(E3-independent) E2 ubiquitin-conjugating enzyme UBE2O-like n=1 Tax=Ptychodera flava TaxID=63121 RepID=UPI003969C3EC
MASLFDEDVVRRNHHGVVQYGLVLRNSEGFSSDSDSDEDVDRVKKGQVCVAWYPKGREEVLSESKVELQDRSLMPGDAVRRIIAGQDSQRGIVHNVEVYVHIQVLKTKHMIYEINSRDLIPLQVFAPEVHVTMSSWLGVVRETYLRIVVKFKNGARCAITGEDASKLTEVYGFRDPECVFYRDSFYPGQILKGPGRVFKAAEWLSGQQPVLSNRKNFKVVVEEVSVDGLDVHWQTRGYSGDADDTTNVEPPDKKVSGDQLQNVHPLNYFVPASIQIGDKGLYLVQPGDMKYPNPVALGSVYCYQRPQTPTENTNPPFLEAVAKLQNNGDESVESEPCVKPQNSFELTNGRADPEISWDKDSVKQECLVSQDCVTEDLEAPEIGQVGDSESRLCRGDGQHTEQQCRGDGQCSEEQNSENCTVFENHFLENDLQPAVSEKEGSMTGATNGAVTGACETSNGTEDFKGMSQLPINISRQIQETIARVKTLCDQKISNYPAHQMKEDLESLEKFHEQLLSEMSSETDGILDRATKLAFQVGGLSISENDANRKVDKLISMNEKLSGEVKTTKHLVSLTGRLMHHLNETCNKAKQELEVANDAINSLQKGSRQSRHQRERHASRGDAETTVDKAEESSSSDESDEDSDEEEEEEDDDDDGSQAGSVNSRASSQDSGTHRRKIVSSILPKHKFQRRMAANKKKKAPPPPEFCEVGDKVCVEVTYTETKVDVKWQDGNVEKGISSSELFPTHQLDELEFFPGDFVTKNDHEGADNIYGLVCKTSHQDRTSTVKWMNKPTQTQPHPVCLHSEEISVYDMQPHPDFTYNVGDVVCRLFFLSNSSNNKPPGTGQQQPCAGQVRWVNIDGTICVAWYDNTQSDVPPQDLFKLDDDDDSDTDWSDGSTDWDDTEVSDSDWETETSDGSSSSEGEVVAIDKIITTSEHSKEITVIVEKSKPKQTDQASAESEKDSQSNDNPEENETGDTESTNQAEDPNADENIKMSVQESCAATEEGETLEASQSKAENDNPCVTVDETVADTKPDVDGANADTSVEDVLVNSSGFCMLESVPESHKFRLHPCTPDDPKKFASTIRKELKLLHSSLPAGILVKGFEDRMDLFSAMISGPAKTPYEDGLFIFDVQLPTNYPNTPPLFYYIAYCPGRLNPNLYNDGKVCVSLLGTWTGRGSQLWTNKSNLLQVLISIQGLILNNEPYYNEAGYEKHRGSQQGLENSRMYNETAVLKLLQSMGRMLNNPPEVFRDEVIDHCTKHGMSLVSRIEMWLAASREDTSTSSQHDVGFPLLPLSKGFVLSIEQPLQVYKSTLAKHETEQQS